MQYNLAVVVYYIDEIIEDINSKYWFVLQIFILKQIRMDDLGVPPDFQEPDYTRILETQDFFPKLFLIPSEIKLDAQQGLKVIKRSQQRPDKYQQQSIEQLTIDTRKIQSYDHDDNKPNPAGHGLLSLFKRTAARRIKLAICICVYNQSKYMLKKTIKGIQQSFKPFLQKAGIMPHEIIITVIFDGLQKMNNQYDQTENMISFFREIDMKNKFLRKPNGKSIDEYFKDLQQQNFNLSRLQEEADENFNLFTATEMQQLETKLFQTQYNQYRRIQDLITEVAEIKKRKKNIRIDSLSVDIYKKYEQVCKNFCLENDLFFDTQEQIQQYLENKRNIKTKLVYEAINQTEILCQRYMQSRKDKAILYPVRLETADFLNPIVDIDEEELQNLKSQEKKQFNYMFLVVKYRNEGKLSSHMLFFQGFCKIFDPEYCILTDVGMKPQQDAVYQMFQYMQLNPKCGGLCGYMNIKLQSGSDDLGYRFDGFQKEKVGCLTRFTEFIFNIQRAQQFEYHFAHMLDKPFQAAFKYIHVLPGAFSAYRWKALKSIQYQHMEPDFEQRQNISETDRQLSDKQLNDSYQEEQTIMRRYLKKAVIDNNQLSLQDANMYLAEDRIMCLGLHALGYDIAYLPNVESTVDPVTSLTRFLGQRRRWINGSWFAFNYVRGHVGERTSCIFLLQVIYYTFVQALTWIGPALFFIAMNLTLIAAVREYVVPLFLDFFLITEDYDLASYAVGIFNIRAVIQSIPDIINYVYILLIFSVALYSLMVNHNDPTFKRIYYSASTAFGLYELVVFILLVYNTVRIFFAIEDDQKVEQFIIPEIYLRGIILFIILGHALPILWSLSFTKYIECLSGLFSYLFYVPTYINLLQVFSFSRIDDISWGTKGLDTQQDIEMDQAQRRFIQEWSHRKYKFILSYVSTNIVFAFVILKISDFDVPRNVIILISMCLVAFLLIFRLIPAAIYLIIYTCKRFCGKKLTTAYTTRNRNNGNRILQILKKIESKSKEIEKSRVKKKKEEEYKQAISITSKLLSKNLDNYGNKLRSRVTQHMLNNNMLVNKELQFKKSKKKINLRKKLKIVQEASLQDSDNSMKGGNNSNNSKINYNLSIPKSSSKQGGDIKERLKSLRQKKLNSGKKSNLREQ